MPRITEKSHISPVQDVLHAAAGAEGPTAMGQRHRGGLALTRINSLRCADAMRRLVADPAYALEHIEEGTIILVSHMLYTDGLYFKGEVSVDMSRYFRMAS